MAGLLTVARKEFVDHVSDRTFLLCFGIFMAAMVGSTFYQLDMMSSLMAQAADSNGFFEAEIWKDPDVSEMLQTVLTSQLSSLGVLVALALSFNSVNKERTEGSLKVLLSYPIGKTRIILGKLLGGFAVVVLVVAASLIVSFSIEVYYLAIPLSGEVLQRLLVISASGILLLLFFLLAGTAVSMVVRDTAACLLALLMIAVLLQPDTVTMILVTIGRLFPKAIPLRGWEGYHYYMPSLISWQMPDVVNLIPRGFFGWSPITAYRTFSARIFHFQNLGSNPPTVIPIPFDWLLQQNLPLFIAPIAYTVAAFAVCLLLARREIA